MNLITTSYYSPWFLRQKLIESRRNSRKGVGTRLMLLAEGVIVCRLEQVNQEHRASINQLNSSISALEAERQKHL